MTSSTKVKLHSVGPYCSVIKGLSHGGHSPQVTSTENVLKFEHVFETREQTDRHTNDDDNTSHLSLGRSN